MLGDLTEWTIPRLSIIHHVRVNYNWTTFEGTYWMFTNFWKKKLRKVNLCDFHFLNGISSNPNPKNVSQRILYLRWPNTSCIFKTSELIYSRSFEMIGNKPKGGSWFLCWMYDIISHFMRKGMKIKTRHIGHGWGKGHFMLELEGHSPMMFKSYDWSRISRRGFKVTLH